MNERSSESTRRLKESIREYPSTTYNDVYNCNITKFQIEDDTVVWTSADNKSWSRYADRLESTSRQIEPNYKSEEPLLALFQTFSTKCWQKTDAKTEWQTSQQNNIRSSWVSKEPEVPKLEEYNFSVSIVKLMSILKDMGEKVRRKRVNSFTVNFTIIMGTCCKVLQNEIAFLLKIEYLKKLLSDRGKRSYM